MYYLFLQRVQTLNNKYYKNFSGKPGKNTFKESHDSGHSNISLIAFVPLTVLLNSPHHSSPNLRSTSLIKLFLTSHSDLSSLHYSCTYSVNGYLVFYFVTFLRAIVFVFQTSLIATIKYYLLKFCHLYITRNE